MKVLRNRLFKSSFIQNVFTVATGAAGLHVITIVFSPFVTRLYGPEAFGLLGTFLAIFGIFSPVATLCYSSAQVIPKDNDEALGLVRVSIWVSFIVFGFLSLLFGLSGSFLIELLGLKSIEGYLIFLPVGVLFAGWTDISQQWLIRNKMFLVAAKAGLIQSLIVNIVKVFIGFFYPFAISLVSITTFGHLLYALILRFGAGIDFGSDSGRGLGKSWELMKKYADFPIYRAPQNLINATSQGLPILMMTSFFGPASAGFYVLGKLLLGVPSALIGKAVGDVFYSEITRRSHNGGMLALPIIKATFGLAVIGVVPFFLIIIYGPWVFSFVFGSQWEEAGIYARWLAVFFFFNFINRPSVAAVPILGIQKGLLFYELLSTGLKIIGLLIGFYFFRDAVFGVALFSIVGSFTYIAMILWIINEAKRVDMI